MKEKQKQQRREAYAKTRDTAAYVDLTIPTMINGQEVTKIASDAFKGNIIIYE